MGELHTVGLYKDLSKDQKYGPPLLLLAILKIIEKDYTELENTVNGPKQRPEV
jgi:hypothetical protein